MENKYTEYVGSYMSWWHISETE